MTFFGFEFLSWVFEVELEVEVSRGGSMWVFKTRSGSTVPYRVKGTQNMELGSENA